MSKYYLAGPMTGIPQFNFPLFERAAKELRDVHGLDIVSPAELDAMDGDEVVAAALASIDGSFNADGTVANKTWGDFLCRDVKLIADTCTGIVFLPGWEKSRGARLEAFVALLCRHNFARYVPGTGMEAMSAQSVLAQLSRITLEDIRNGT